MLLVYTDQVKFMVSASQIFSQGVYGAQDNSVPYCFRNIFKQVPILSFISVIEKDLSNDGKWNSLR